MRYFVVALSLSACGGAGDVAETSSAVTDRWSAWSEPVALDAVNTGAQEFANGISKDGLTFYFQRGDAAVNGEDIWIVRRAATDAPWGTPVKLSDTVNTAYNDRGAFESPDGHWLFFASNRPGGYGGFDLMVSWRADVHDDLAWGAAQNLGPQVNTPGFDSGPALFQDDETGVTYLYYSSNPAGPQGAGVDIYMSLHQPDGSFGAPSLVTELSVPGFNEGRLYLRHDGREIFFYSNRPGGRGGQDLWSSTRATSADPWSPPQPVDGIDTSAAELTPVLSWDARTLFFASDRTGAPGQNGEIFYATRDKLRGNE